MQNNVRRNVGKIMVAVGAVLILTAAIWYGSVLYRAYRAGKAAEDVLYRMKDTEDVFGWKDHYRDEENDTNEMPIVYIDGYGYIGYLSVPSYGLELPVMDEWSMEGLNIAPGRYSGSVYTNDMVIAGHNYARHFSSLKWAETGTKVIFTDMDGISYYYEIYEIETLNPTQVEEMIDPSGDWDLTLFTCTTGGAARSAIRCKADA